VAKQVGRPKNTDGLDLMELEPAIKRLQEEMKYQTPPYSRRTLINKFWSGELTRHGTYHKPQVDFKELKRLASWKKKVS
jgi:hypothetical protein